ncbi:helix-turn-helix domain-containing protein [Clostridioides difficile]|nr:helix-turn-helix domain-containing protein [Clostridioides difficile]
MLRKRNGTFSFTITTLKVGLDEMLRSQEKVSAEELTKLRKEKRMTQEQLAELAGVSQNHLSKLESGCRQ